MRHILIDIAAASGHLRLYYEDEQYTASISDGVTSASIVVPGGQIPARDGKFALRYDAASFALLYGGLVLGSVADPPLPSGVGTMRLGCDAAGNQWDDVVGPVRVSSRARTNAELGAVIRIDEDATVYLPFTETLAAGYMYAAAPFNITLPDDRDDQISRATLTVDNVDRRIVEAIRSIGSAASVMMRIVTASTPQQVEAGPFEFRLSGVSYDALTVEGTLGYEEDFLNVGFPADDFTPQTTPGLFA